MVGLEPAGGNHNGISRDLEYLAATFDTHTANLVAIGHQGYDSSTILDANAAILGDPGFLFDDAWSAAPIFGTQPSPEPELVIDLEGLASVAGYEADAASMQPLHGFKAVADQTFAKIRISTVLGDTEHVVEELVLRVDAEIGVGDFTVGEVGHDVAHVVDAVIGVSHGTSGKPAVAAALVLGRALKHTNAGTLFLRGKGGTEGRVTRTNDNDIGFDFDHGKLSEIFVYNCIQFVTSIFSCQTGL